MSDPARLRTALERAAQTAAEDYEAAAKAGDIRRRYDTAKRLDALRQLAGDDQALHLLSQALAA